MRIKRVIREDLPETNSSSSHSVVISMNSEHNLDRRDWGLKIDENTQTLYIPTFSGFGREFFCSNSVLVKLQYLSCFFISGTFKKKVSMSKMMHRFEVVLKDILGVKNIVFEEAVDIWTRMKSGDIPKEDSIYYDFPEIDWQSRDLKEEILETPETLKNFLLNPDSWVYGGDDSESKFSSKFSATQKQPETIGYYSADLQGIGRVDVEITPLSDIGWELSSVFTNFYCNVYGYFSMTGDKKNIDYTTLLEYNGYDDESRSLIFSNYKTHSRISIPLNLTIYDTKWLSIS